MATAAATIVRLAEAWTAPDLREAAPQAQLNLK
jgi:hypothetical protein